MSNTNESKTGIESIEGNTITISDADKFAKHLKTTSEKYNSVGKNTPKQDEEEPILKIADVKLNPIHLACLDDDMRPNLKLIEIKNNIASATNGSMIVKIDLSMVSQLTPDMLNILDGRFIHMNVWSDMAKCDSLELTDDYIIVNKSGINKLYEYSESQGEFFKMNSIIQDVKEAGIEAKSMIAYNPKYLTILSKIFNTECLYFSFSKGNQGTIIFPTDGGGMFSLLMPIDHNSAGVNRYFFM